MIATPPLQPSQTACSGCDYVNIMSTPYLGTTLPSMEKWVQVHVLLSIAALTLYPLLTEGFPLQQVPPPALETELDQCEFKRYGDYEEHCGSESGELPTCNPGQSRVWQCDPETGLPDDKFVRENLNICQNCPEGSFQKWHNKCGTCHPCTVCGEGETEEKACEMEEDTKCVKVSAGAGSLPAIATPSTEGTLNPTETASPLNPSSEHVLTYGVTPEIETPIQTAPLKVTAVEVLNDSPHSTTVSFYVVVALVVFFALLSVFTSIGWYRESLIKERKPQAVNPDNFPLNLVNNNGNVPHDNEDREHAEGDPLLGAKQQGAEPDIPVRGDARHAVGPLAVDGIQRTKCPSDVAVDLGVGGRCAGTSEGAPCVGGDGSTGGASGTTTDEGDDGWNNHAHGSTSNVEEQGAVMIPDDACGTRSTSKTINHPLDLAASSSASDDGIGCSGGTTDGEMGDGKVVDIPDETRAAATEHPCDDTNISSNLPVESATPPCGDDKADSKEGNKPGETLVIGSLPPDGLAKSQGTPNAKTTSASGDCLTDDANSDGAAASCEVDEDSNSNKSSLCSDGGDMEGPGSVHAPPSAAPEEGATIAGIDSNGTTDTDGANHDAAASGGGQDVPVVESSDDVPASACRHSSDGVNADARDPNTAPEQVKPQIQADDVVSHMFLQHVAQAVPYLQVKIICRMRGLLEKDIDNIEVLVHQAERAYELLKKLLGEIGKDLTYRSLLEALNCSQNKYYADILIREFDIRI